MPLPLTKDYYRILGVACDADPEEIKKAFRLLALKTHPDRNPNDPNAAKRFRDAAEAWEVLRDPQKRSQYDNVHKGWNPKRTTRNGTHFYYKSDGTKERPFTHEGTRSHRGGSGFRAHDDFRSAGDDYTGWTFYSNESYDELVKEMQRFAANGESADTDDLRYGAMLYTLNRLYKDRYPDEAFTAYNVLLEFSEMLPRVKLDEIILKHAGSDSVVKMFNLWISNKNVTVDDMLLMRVINKACERSPYPAYGQYEINASVNLCDFVRTIIDRRPKTLETLTVEFLDGLSKNHSPRSQQGRMLAETRQAIDDYNNPHCPRPDWLSKRINGFFDGIARRMLGK